MGRTAKIMKKKLKEETEQIREKIRGLLPADGRDKADILFELCQHCAWHEQNRVDYEGSLLTNLGYEEDAKKEKHEMELTSYRLGFN